MGSPSAPAIGPLKRLGQQLTQCCAWLVAVSCARCSAPGDDSSTSVTTTSTSSTTDETGTASLPSATNSSEGGSSTHSEVDPCASALPPMVGNHQLLVSALTGPGTPFMRIDTTYAFVVDPQGSVTLLATELGDLVYPHTAIAGCTVMGEVRSIRWQGNAEQTLLLSWTDSIAAFVEINGSQVTASGRAAFYGRSPG